MKPTPGYVNLNQPAMDKTVDPLVPATENKPQTTAEDKEIQILNNDSV